MTLGLLVSFSISIQSLVSPLCLFFSVFHVKSVLSLCWFTILSLSSSHVESLFQCWWFLVLLAIFVLHAKCPVYLPQCHFLDEFQLCSLVFLSCPITLVCIVCLLQSSVRVSLLWSPCVSLLQYFLFGMFLLCLVRFSFYLFLWFVFFLSFWCKTFFKCTLPPPRSSHSHPTPDIGFTLNKNINAILLILLPFFMSWT